MALIIAQKRKNEQIDPTVTEHKASRIQLRKRRPPQKRNRVEEEDVRLPEK